MSTKPLQAKEIFVELVGNVAPEDWEQRLTELCGDDDEVRTRVRALLQAHADPSSYLDRPAVEPIETVEFKNPLEVRGENEIGPYKLLQKIGEGGMGVVYMAEQTEPVERRIALKIIKPGTASRSVIARFEAERQALALMEHPNIAKVLDAGATSDGRPYFAMELVRGVPITEYCDSKRLTPRERMELFLPVCQAVQHAHQKGVIHRDLKPSNVLIASYDGQPVPKVIDFGVAKATGPKLTDKTMFTEFGAVIGTLEYMSPEQAELNQLDVDTRSDVYSLGVLLYELLTGTTPLDRERMQQTAIQEVLRAIREDDPPRPSTRVSTVHDLPKVASNRSIEFERLRSLLSGELDWIVMRTLEKDRTRRYESASALGADIQRFLSGDAVEACPPSAFYRFRKLARRHQVALVTTAIVAASLLLGTGVSLWQMTVARGAEAQAQANLKEAVAAEQRAIEAEELATSRLAAEEQARQDATREASRARELSEFLIRALESASPDSGKSADYTVRELLDNFAEAGIPRLQSQPALLAEFQLLLGNAYALLDMPEKAAPQLEAALKAVEAATPQNELALAKTLLGVATVRMMQRQHVEQEKFARRSANLYDKIGIVDEDSIEALHLVQLSWIALGENEKAFEVYEEATQAIARAPEPVANYANLLHDHARALVREDKADQAEEIARLAVKTHLELHGPNHRETGWGHHILGLTLISRGKYTEAIQPLRDALAVFTRIYGQSHFSLQSTIPLLVRALNQVEDLESIEALRIQFPKVFESAADFAVATARFPAEEARGKTIVYSGWIKTEELEDYATLWWRAADENGIVAFDNMSHRAPTATTDWERYEITLEIPAETTHIVYGVLMAGRGSAWFDSLEVTIDGEPYRDESLNYGFETASLEGFTAPVRPGYQTALDDRVAHSGKKSLRMIGIGTDDEDAPVWAPVSTLVTYEGAYTPTDDRGSEVVIRRKGSTLTAQFSRGAPMTLKAVSETEFVYGEVTIVFQPGEDGAVETIEANLFGREFTATRRRPIAVTEEELRRFVGEYRHSSELSFWVTTEGDQIFVRLTNQPALRVYPRSKTSFYYEVVIADIEFRENDQGEVVGLTLFQNGGVVPAEKVIAEE